MRSRIYEGVLRHRRVAPRQHEFQYQVAMPYLCLDELPTLFSSTPFWSARGAALAQFRRSDFLGDPALPLADEVRRRIREETTREHTGPIYLLANLRYFGYVINPIACYYWRSNTPDRRLVLHMENSAAGERVFDATLSLAAKPMTGTNLNKLLFRYPLMTAKVGLAIYWQALRLYLKGVPVHTHPNKHAIGAPNE